MMEPVAAFLQQNIHFQTIRQLLDNQHIEAYLVGGAVRDLLLGRADIVDFDFLVFGDGLEIARQVADALNAAYYPLDPLRGTGRVILPPSAANRAAKLHLDFAAARGATLLEDLQDRDFTVNAMALSLSCPPALIDPLRGQVDLKQKRLRAASPLAFEHDPLRVLRAVRQVAEFGFTLDPQTEQWLRQATDQLPRTSPERQRDELLKILNTPAPGQAVQMMRMLGVLPHILPEVDLLAGVEQGPPHYLDVFDHTVAALDAWSVMFRRGLPDLPEAHRASVQNYLQQQIPGDLHLYQLLPPALLLHDTGKLHTRTEPPDTAAKQVRFLGHEKVSQELARGVLKRLRFSNYAIDCVSRIVRNHMRPLLLAASGGQVSRKAIYRYFRDTDSPHCEAGILTVLHALADHQATYPPTSAEEQTRRAALLGVIERLITAYFENRDRLIQPPPLLTGRDLINLLGLSEGPLIGKLLRRLQEAQAIGQVQTRAEALAFIQSDPYFVRQKKSPTAN